MTLPNFPSPWMTEEHHTLQDSVARFFKERWVPQAPAWREAGRMPRETWNEAGAQGLLCLSTPAEYGGGGGDFGHDAVVILEAARANLSGYGGGLHSAIVAPYLFHCGTEDQKQRFLPRMVTGELVSAIAMTEPGTGSDLAAIATSAVRDGDEYVVNGSKTFITNGINSDLVVTAVKTDPAGGHRGLSLLVVEAGMEGFERGRNLEKVGTHAQDTAELFFNDVRVPVANLLGEEGSGFRYLVSNLGRERLSIAISAVASARAALGETLAYVQDRRAFGAPIGSFQHSRFTLAELSTEIELASVFVDACVEALNAGELSDDDAARAKWWCTELQGRVVDRCLQLHGGYGYMLEYPIARAFADARVTRIYGGTTEIMKEIVARSLGL